MAELSEYQVETSAFDLDHLEDFGIGGTLSPTRLQPVGSVFTMVTVTIKHADGSPAAGIDITAESEPAILKGPEWRSVRGLTSRWPPKSAAILTERIAQGIVRLKAGVTPPTGKTNANGQWTVKVSAWHVCGEENQPAADDIVFRWGTAQSGRHRIECGMNLIPLPQNIAWKVETSPGIRGRYVQQSLIDRFKNIGYAWDDVENGPDATDFPIVVTDASTKWGGLFPPHLNHRWGGTIDLRTPSVDGKPSRPGAPNYDRAGVEWLSYILGSAGATEIRFAEGLKGVTVIDATHADHLHVSFLKNPNEPWLIQPIEKGAPWRDFLDHLSQ